MNPKDGPRTGWTDISVFKRKFGGRELRLVPTLEHIYDQNAYEEWEASEQEDREQAGQDVAQVESNKDREVGSISAQL